MQRVTSNEMHLGKTKALENLEQLIEEPSTLIMQT